MRLPTETDLKLFGGVSSYGMLSGTFLDGLDIPTAFPTISSSGTFDHTFSHNSIDINGVDFGSSIGVRFYRTTPNGNIRLRIDHSLSGGFIGANLDLYVSTGGTFRLRLDGSLSLPIGIFSSTWGTLDGNPFDNLELASLDLDMANSPLYQFQGTARIGGVSFSVVLGTFDSYIEPNVGQLGFIRFPLPRLPE